MRVRDVEVFQVHIENGGLLRIDWLGTIAPDRFVKFDQGREHCQAIQHAEQRAVDTLLLRAEVHSLWEYRLRLACRLTRHNPLLCSQGTACDDLPASRDHGWLIHCKLHGGPVNARDKMGDAHARDHTPSPLTTPRKPMVKPTSAAGGANLFFKMGTRVR